MKLGITKDRVVTLAIGVMLGLTAWGGTNLYTTASNALTMTDNVGVLLKERELMMPINNALYQQYVQAQQKAAANAAVAAQPPQSTPAPQ